MPTPIECHERIRSVLTSLEISTDLIAARSLVLHPEAQELVVAATGEDGREHMLAPAAAAKWREVSAAAPSDGGIIKIAAAFRSVDRPPEIKRRHVAVGCAPDAHLLASRPPRYAD